MSIDDIFLRQNVDKNKCMKIEECGRNQRYSQNTCTVAPVSYGVFQCDIK